MDMDYESKEYTDMKAQKMAIEKVSANKMKKIINGKIEQENMVLDWLRLIPTMTIEKHEKLIKVNAKIEALKELIEEVDILD